MRLSDKIWSVIGSALSKLVFFGLFFYLLSKFGTLSPLTAALIFVFSSFIEYPFVRHERFFFSDPRRSAVARIAFNFLLGAALYFVLIMVTR